MKIGMILDKQFPTDVRVENEAVSLLEAGFEVALFCLSYDDEPKTEIVSGIKVCRFSSSRWEYKLSALAYSIPVYSILMAHKITKFIKQEKPNVLHVHDIRIAEAVFKANKKFNLKVVLDLHDNFPEIMKFYPHLQKFPGKYLISPKKWKRKEEEFIKKADKIITVSPQFVHEVVNRTNVSLDKMALVPNTIRKSFYENAEFVEEIINRYQNDFVLLYVGDTNLRRGLLTAIEAVSLLKENIKNIKLVIVGTNTTDLVLKKRVRDFGVENYVDFQGWQNVSLFPSYIKASEICISPLYRNIQHDVAYANKLFQYMAFAKPLLVSDAIAQKEIVEEQNCGLVHQEKNAKDFADKVLELYENEKKCIQLGLNGEQFVKNKFTWEHTSKELHTLYKNLQS